jgi:hypothetical protein
MLLAGLAVEIFVSPILRLRTKAKPVVPKQFLVAEETILHNY